MKYVILSLVLIISFFASVITYSQANDPFAPSDDPFAAEDSEPLMIRVHTEFIEMPHATFTELMAAPRTTANDTDLRERCAELIEKNEARIIESLTVNALPGQSATTANITEFVYPTEYEWSSHPLQVKAVDISSKLRIGFPSTPPAFETKNVGSTLEVEANFDNSKFVEVRLTPTIVYHTGEDVWGAWTNGDVTIESSKPRFYMLKTVTGATMITGQPHMLSAHSPQDKTGSYDPSRKIMLFVRADVITLN